MLNKVEVLTKARELISEESKWTRGWLAKDSQGASVSPINPEATCWCAEGAIDKVIKEKFGLTLMDEGDPHEMVDIEFSGTLDLLFPIIEAKKLPNGIGRHIRSVNGYNDRSQTTHADILKLFDDAIEASRKEEQ